MISRYPVQEFLSLTSHLQQLWDSLSKSVQYRVYLGIFQMVPLATLIANYRNKVLPPVRHLDNNLFLFSKIVFGAHSPQNSHHF